MAYLGNQSELFEIFLLEDNSQETFRWRMVKIQC